MEETALLKNAIEELQAEVSAQAVVIAVLANCIHDADVATLDEISSELERIAPRVSATHQVRTYAASLRGRRTLRPHLSLVKSTD